MNYCRTGSDKIEELWKLQKLYKSEIGEDEPDGDCMNRLKKAIEEKTILFFCAFDGTKLVGCCSVTPGFSTFTYSKSGVFEDFYILPEYRHKGIARALVNLACRESGVSSLTVGCADCDADMYSSLGFSVKLGYLLAFDMP